MFKIVIFVQNVSEESKDFPCGEIKEEKGIQVTNHQSRGLNPGHVTSGSQSEGEKGIQVNNHQ